MKPRVKAKTNPKLRERETRKASHSKVIGLNLGTTPVTIKQEHIVVKTGSSPTVKRNLAEKSTPASVHMEQVFVKAEKVNDAASTNNEERNSNNESAQVNVKQEVFFKIEIPDVAAANDIERFSEIGTNYESTPVTVKQEVFLEIELSKAAVSTDINEINLEDIAIDGSNNKALSVTKGNKTNNYDTHIDCNHKICIKKRITHPPTMPESSGKPCHICHKYFTYTSHLAAHMRIHTGERPYPCSKCEKTFQSGSNLKRHMQSHSGEKPFACDECARSFSEAGHLKAHKLTHSRERPYSCKKCNKTFVRRSDLKDHMENHDEENSLKSNECAKPFLSGKNTIVTNKKDRHNVNTEKCDDEESTVAIDRSNHKVQSAIEGIKSNIYDSMHLNCNHKICIKKRNKDVHLRPESPGKPCHICHKHFTYTSHLEAHMRTHTGEKPYVCSQCDKTFQSGSNLKRHMQSHSGEKPFVCDECDRGFREAGHLKQHKLIHTGERPYSCKKCHKSFVRSSGLKDHLQIHAEEKTFKCDVCEKLFISAKNVRKHMRIHTGERPFACNQCEKAYTNTSNLKKHLLIHSDLQRKSKI